MEILTKIAAALLIIGGLNWGLIGLVEFDLVAFLFGPMSWLSRIIYMLVGVSAIWVLVDWARHTSLTR